MIQHLHLENLVLVDTCDVEFPPHFTALTGETGAGKTALIEAVSLCLGSRADASLIRSGASKACVEMSLDISALHTTHTLLDEAGIACDPQDPLIIRRELSKEGKNRAFINCQMVPLPMLQRIGSTLLELIGQHTHQRLVTTEFQRETVDLFGDCTEALSAFQQAWKRENELKKKLDSLLLCDAKREREEEMLRAQAEEIATAKLQEGEEELIAEEHQRLFHAQQMGEKIDVILSTLSTLIPESNRCSKLCDSLTTIDSSLKEAQTLLSQASISLNEAQHELQHTFDQLDHDPTRFVTIEERLSIIHRLKRKYGKDISTILAFLADLKAQLNALEHLSDEIEDTQHALRQAALTSTHLSQALTLKRTHSAKLLSEQLTSQIRSLNMPSAEIEIRIEPQPRSLFGDDWIQFWIRANVGEHSVPIKDHASGGELSRLLFAIKICLAEKNDTPTLIFDEIDANVGGKTAGIIGEKLLHLGRYRQVICISHFPQVAAQANAHITVQKIEKEGRTLTTIHLLSAQEREQELLRMLGGKKINAEVHQ